MKISDDLIINAELHDVLFELRQQLIFNNSYLLGTMKETDTDIMVSCPYHKNGQERKPSAGIRKSDGMFHCFRAGTKVLTDKGAKNIETLINNSTKIMNGNGCWEDVVFHNYGKTNLMKIILTQDCQEKTIYATSNHEWFVKGYKKLIRTDNLKSGMYLQQVINRDVKYNFNLDGFLHGVIFGDGTRILRYKTKRSETHRIILKDKPIGCYYIINIPKFNKKSKLINYFKMSEDWNVSEMPCMNGKYISARSHQFDLSHNFKEPPNVDDDFDYKMSFLSGYFATDGSIDLSNISCADYGKLNQVRDLFISCGVAVRDIRCTTRTNTYVDGIHKLYILPIIRKSLSDAFYVLEDSIPPRKHCRTRWKVQSVEMTDIIENVYCCETTTKSFVLDGNILTHNCFACGETHPLDEVISYCLGYTNDVFGVHGKQWLLKNFVSISLEERKDVKLDLSRNRDTTININNREFVTDEELDNYRYYHSYWTKRGITDDNIIELFDLGYDKETDCITMPVRDEDGNCLFVARRSTKYKYFNYPKGAEKPLYGLYELNATTLVNFPKEIYVTESMIDALLLWQSGRYAVALNGTGSKEQLEMLSKLPCRKLVLATDNDDAGYEARKRIRRYITNKIITEIEFPPNRKDIGECTKEEIENLKESIL